MHHRQQIVAISGPPGVGKTTVARVLKRLVGGSICIDGDQLRAFAPEDAKAYLGRGSSYRAAGALVGAYLAMGAPRVIFDYCFVRPAHVEAFESAVPHDFRPYVFTLWASLATVKAREQDRPGREPLKEAVDACHAEMASNLGTLGTIIDAEVATPEEVAARINTVLLAAKSARANWAWVSPVNTSEPTG